MAKCTYCGSTIVFGGVQEGELRFCNADCQQKGSLMRLARLLPANVVEQAVQAAHTGNCPRCKGPGPVDVHVSYRVWSALLLTTWTSRPQVCCSSCGRNAKLGDAAFCLLLGWWGFPWGLIVTPIQIGRNLFGLTRKPDPGKPSDSLRNVVSVAMASSVLQTQARTPPGLPPQGPPPGA